MDYLADTVYLIDLWRQGGSAGKAARFARRNSTKQVGISWIAAGEFLGGSVSANQDRERVSLFLSGYLIVHSEIEIVEKYAEIYADLRTKNRMIGPNDLWIAATAVRHDLPLLTRNVGEFSRVEGLKISDYSSEI